VKVEEVDDEIVDKFMLSFSNGDYDTEIDNKLSSDRNLIVPDVRPTQASYNKPDNWRERNQRGVEKVKGWLQDCVECVENGPSFGLYFIHNFGEWEPLRDNEEPIVWHEPILEEYWDQLKEIVDELKKILFRRFQQDIAPDIQEFEIVNVEMTKECMDKLVAIFTATNSSHKSN
jgi:hypothetical protein